MNSYNKLKIKYNTALTDLENISKQNTVKAEKYISKPTSRLTREKSSIIKWRNALDQVESIEYSSYADLIRIYREIDIDSEITSVKTIRKNYVLSRDYFLTKNDIEDERAIEFFNTGWFNDFVNLVLESQYWGYSLIQLGNIENDILTGVSLIQRQNVNPTLGVIQKSIYSTQDVKSYTDEEYVNWYILASDSSDDNYVGLYNKLAPYQISVKSAQSAFSDYTARFGSPNVVAKIETSDESHVRATEDYLENFSNASYAIIGTNDDVTLVESAGNDGKVFESLLKENKSNITKLILGTDTINTEKSFVGSAKISEGIANVYSLNDVKLVEKYINNELLPRLVKLGLPFLNDVVFKYDTTNKSNPEEEFNKVIELSKLGYRVPSEFITKRFGIPIEEVEEIIEKVKKNDE